MSGEAHIAYADKAAAVLAGQVDLPYPETYVKTIDGVVGVIQREYPDIETDLSDQPMPGLKKDTLEQVQRQHAFDWLIGNHNTQGQDLLLRRNGELLGMNKEPFRFYGQDSISVRYNPYPEQVSYYNHWFGEYAAGALADRQFRLDPKAELLMEFLDAAERLPEEEFLGTLKMYSSRAAAAKKRWSETAFLNEALGRKRALRRTIKSFYESLERRRKG